MVHAAVPASALTSASTLDVSDASGPLLVVGAILLILGLLLLINRLPKR